MIQPRISQYQPVATRGEDGHVTVNWNTPDGNMPRDGNIEVSPQLIMEWVNTVNALVDAERLLGLRT